MLHRFCNHRITRFIPSTPSVPRMFHTSVFIRALRSTSVHAVQESYVESHSSQLPLMHHLQALQEETLQTFTDANKMTSMHQGVLLNALVSMLRAERVLELGTFTGFAAICMGLAIDQRLPQRNVTTCDTDEKAAAIAKKWAKTCGLDGVVQIRIGDALQTLKNLQSSRFDFVYLDADKANYIQYYEALLTYDLLAENGVILADNVLYRGHVSNLDAEYVSEIPKHIRKTAEYMAAFNDHVLKDRRTKVVILPLYDGISIIQRAHT